MTDAARFARAGSAPWLAFSAAFALFTALAATGSVTAQDDAARSLFEQSCANCHALSLATSQGHSPAEWNDVVQQMIGYGAQLGPDQAREVTAYLADHYPLATPQYAFPEPAKTRPAQLHPRPATAAQWPAYGGGGANHNFSPLDEITARNVAKLQPAWTYHYGAGRHEQGDQGLDYRFEVTPLLIDGVMYISTPSWPQTPGLKSSVTALNPATGEVIWKYQSDKNIHGRGLAYWPGDADHAPRLIFGTDGGFLMAVDVTTGQLAQGFGRNGAIDAYVGVASEVVGDTRRATWTVPNPVTIFGDLVITGSRPGEANPPAPRGDIRAWDARSGRLVWTFHTIPQPGEPNGNTYAEGEWRDISGANVWSSMALDEKNGIVYAPLADLNARAEGSELYANSLVALDAATGKLIWYRQITHKDLWDWDLPTPPVLLDVEQDGKTVPAVLVTGKLGLLFLFNRLTGEPLNGYTERPTPRTDLPGVEPWPTQPFPDAPGPLARITMSRDEIPDLAPGMRKACQALWDKYDIHPGELYSLPNTTTATLIYPGPTGGPNWGGGAYSPSLGMYFINLQNRPRFSPPQSEAGGFLARPRATQVLGRPAEEQRSGGRGGPRFEFELEDGTSIPCAATPWGELVAVDLAGRRIAWRVPLGEDEHVPGDHPDIGAPNLGGSLATAGGLVFIGASNDRKFRAFDARTGRKLWEYQLEASAHATPVSYRGSDGRQYVVVAAGGGTSVGGPVTSDTLVAFALPKK